MHIEHHKWWSENLNRDMELKIYGEDGGVPYLVFPCSRGRFFDYEGFGMTERISYFINSKKIQLYTVDGIDSESWYNFSVLPGDRNARHEAYDRYIVREVVPFILKRSPGSQQRIMTTGASMGAYHAVNFYFKHPDVFKGTIALSGLYRLNRDEFGLKEYDMPHVYFNSPISYLKNMGDPHYLDLYRHGEIVICVGQGAWEEKSIEDTREMDYILKAKRVPAWVDYWGTDVNHDWPWWYVQMNYFLEHLHP
ncbi:MAG: esterase family protein [Deltaproteobacteria bacterium]|nr:esterase family protein [Deltaproteobacteria bacterium]